jgi:hypothetical protein
MGAASLLGVRQVWLLFGFFFDYRLLIVIFVLLFFLVSWKEDKEYD